MSGYLCINFKVTGKTLKFGATLAAAMLLVLIVGAGRRVQGQTFSVLHNFDLNNDDGGFSVAGVVRDQAGNLYGTTKNGGLFSKGAVFKIDTAGNETLLHSFSGLEGTTPDGATPYGGLVLDSAGNLYGTTTYGGAGWGTVFKIDTSGTETVLYSFDNTHGAYPFAGLTRDATGDLYGTTLLGGTLNLGTVFKIDTSGNETVLYNFTGTDGATPFADVTLDSAGNIYGATFAGGDSGYGVVFKIDTSGTETVLHSFNSADGANPYGGLAVDSAGNLYGTTHNGGTYGYGTVFKIEPSGTETTLVDLEYADGGHPYGDVVLDQAGNLYGTTYTGGVSSLGTLFKIDSTGQFEVVHNFVSADGGGLYAGVILDSSGNLYGTTNGAGKFDYGTVYEIVQTIPFSAFAAKLELTSGFELKADFALGAGGTPINLTTQGLTLSIGTYSVTIPAAEFQQAKQGWFEYDGTINGGDLRVRLTQTGANAYEVMVHAQGVDLGSPTDPVTLKLVIGNNSGATQIDAH